jgi:hypothetical protein
MLPANKPGRVASREINPELQWALWAFLLGFAVGLGLKFV